MNFNLNTNRPVIALLGAGAMGIAIVKRIGAGKTILLGDISEEHLLERAHELASQGYICQTFQVDACDRDSVRAFANRAAELGEVMYFIDTAGASPNQASGEFILKLDGMGTGIAIEEFAKVIARGGAGLIISSQTGYMRDFSSELEKEFISAAPEGLLEIQEVKEKIMPSSGMSYIAAKRINHLQVRKAAATSWAKAGARINSVSPGIIVTPLAYDEFNAAGNSYQKMIDASPAKRVGTPEEVASAAAFLLGNEAGFITGIDLLIDGGVIANMKSGQYDINL